MVEPVNDKIREEAARLGIKEAPIVTFDDGAVTLMHGGFRPDELNAYIEKMREAT